MNWKFWKRKKISAYDIEYLDDVNRRSQEEIEQLEKYRELLCPNISKAEDTFFRYHNSLLSDAINNKIVSIRNYQMRMTLQK